MLDIVPSCNLVQYQGKLMMQPWENGKNPDFRPNLRLQNFFSWVLPLLVVRQYSKLSSYAISRKTNEQNLKYTWNKFDPSPPPKNLFGSDVVPSYHPMQGERKLINEAWENEKKPSFGWSTWPKFGPPIFFWKKSGSISHYILWSAIIMYNIRKN